MTHPIQGLMESSMKNIKEMIDVNTIIGEAVQTPDGTTIIPVSKVTFLPPISISKIVASLFAILTP